MPRRERPLGPGDDLVVGFAADLRRLREDAGSPTYRELSARAGYSASALSDAAGGRKLPGLALTTAYVKACNGDVQSWDERWRAIAAELAAAAGEVPASTEDTAIPYLGLAAFQPGDSGRFFGRERLIAELAAKVGKRRFVGVFGASGSGKSSLLRAGLIATNAQRWAMVFTPGEHPLEQCAAGLASKGHLLIVDQFEEVFTLCHDEDERTRFVDALLALAEDAEGSQVVLGVRADFYGHCGRHAGLVDALRDAQVMVGPMNGDELRTAIVEPAVRFGCRVEATLVTRLISDATGQPAVLPLVSHALLETWRRRQGVTLTVAGYEAAGGIHNAIAHSAEAVYADLDSCRQTIVKQIFLRLTALGEGTEDTKRRLSRRELDTEDPATALVLERLTDARLLALDQDGVEIAHEALIRSWPRLRDWLADDREGLRIHRQLTEATGTWESLDRDPGTLYRGTRLALAAEWSNRARISLTPRERAFLTASLAAEAAETAAVRKRTRRLRRLVALLGVLLLLAAGTTVIAIRSQLTATAERNVALARKVVADAAALRTTNPALSVQLSLAAYRLAQVPESHDGLVSALATPFTTRLDFEPDGVDYVSISKAGRLMVTAGDVHTVKLWSIADPLHPGLLATLPEATRVGKPVVFSPDGHTLVTGVNDYTLWLWDITDPHHPVRHGVVTGHTQVIQSAEISPDGHTLATGAADSKVLLTDISNLDAPKTLAVLGEHTASLNAVTFSPDGRVLATASNDKTAQLWDVGSPSNPRRLTTISGHQDIVASVAFSPDGHTLATGSWDLTVRLWDVTVPGTTRPLAVLPTPAIEWGVAFSPDGRTLAAASDDQLIRVWDLVPGGKPVALTPITGHTNFVRTIQFTPDGNTLVTAAADRTLRLEDVRELSFGFHGGTGAWRFTPDGKALVTTSATDIGLWAIDSPRATRQLAKISGEPGRITAIALSPDGRGLAVASVDAATGATLRRWDIGNRGAPRLVASAAVKPAYSLAFSPDGRTLTAGYDDGPVDLWDVSDPSRFARPVTLPFPAGTVWAQQFSPDGHTLFTVAGGTDSAYAVLVWDVEDPRHPQLISRMKAGVDAFVSLALSPDGRTLVAGSTDHVAYVWDVSDRLRPALLSTLDGHADTVASVAFSPDGKQIGTSSADHTARLWDIADPRHPVQATQFIGYTTAVNSITFSPDGHTVATGSSTVQLWETDVPQVAAAICQMAAPGITPAEWNHYFPGLPYTPPCP